MSNASPSWLQFSTPSTAKHVAYGVIIGIMLSAAATTTVSLLPSSYRERKRQRRTEASSVPPRPIEIRTDEILNGVTGLIGTLAF